MIFCWYSKPEVGNNSVENVEKNRLTREIFFCLFSVSSQIVAENEFCI